METLSAQGDAGTPVPDSAVPDLGVPAITGQAPEITGQAPEPGMLAELDELRELGDPDLLLVVRSQPRGSGRRAAACEILVSRHRGLVRACAARYRRSPEPAEDLVQVGFVGLLKAINNFDPSFGGSLAAYAQPCISGEIKRHFRDKRWQVHVERSVQELVLEVRKVSRELTQELGRAPADEELAQRLGVSCARITEARLADLVFSPVSLDAPLSDRPDAAGLADILGAEDPGMDHAVDMQALRTHWGELPGREQRILLMRFYGDRTQAQIGAELGISQMHVSRLLAHALRYLRSRILDNDPAAAAA